MSEVAAEKSLVIDDGILALMVEVENPHGVSEAIWQKSSKKFLDKNWNTMLSAAPVCIELLGSCLVAAASRTASTTELTPPAKGFVYLRGYKFLKTSLIEVANEGRKSFLLAYEKMDYINQMSESIKEDTKEVFKELRQSKGPNMDSLGIQMNGIASNSRQCQEAAEAMQLRFTQWLHFVMELHEACQEAEGHNEVKFSEASSKETAAKVLEKERIKTQQKQEEVVKKMETLLDDDHEAYTKTLKEYPDGNTFLKQQLIMVAADTLSSVLNIGATAAAAYVSPLSAIANGAKAAGDLKDKFDNNDDDDETDVPKKKEDLEDPAVSYIEATRKAIAALKSIVEGDSKDGVNWELVGNRKEKEKDDKKDEKDEKDDKKDDDDEDEKDDKKDDDDEDEDDDETFDLAVTKQLLSYARKNVTQIKDKKAIGKKLLKYIDSCSEVIRDLTAEARDSKDLTKKWEKPAKSSKKVKDWQSKVKKAHKGVYSLSSAAGSSGKTSTRSPLVIPPENPEVTKAKLKGRRDINRATLENARNKLEQARAGYASSQAAFQKSTTELNAISQQLGDLRSDLAKLADEKVTLATVRDVLESCIGFLITLKDKVTELTMFFSSINVLIQVAVDTSVNKFEQYVAQGIKELGNGKPIADRIHQLIQTYAIEIAAQFSLYVKISKMYKDIHTDYIGLGFKTVDEMSALVKQDETEQSKIAEKTLALTRYSTDAQEGIKQRVQLEIDGINAEYASRIERIDKLIKSAPQSKVDEETKQAIKSGADAAETIEEQEPEDKDLALKAIAAPKEKRQENTKNFAEATKIDESDLDF